MDEEGLCWGLLDEFFPVMLVQSREGLPNLFAGSCCRDLDLHLPWDLVVGYATHLGLLVHGRNLSLRQP